MTIRDLLIADRPTLSYELFPPRTEQAQAALWDTLDRLARSRPDFASITYGASGSTLTSGQQVVTRLRERHGVETLAHLTCVGQSRQQVVSAVESFLDDGVRDFLALRGDPPQGQTDWRPHPDGLLYASELVALIREVARAHGLDVSIAVTAFPAAHVREQWRQQGLEVLRAKQDAGADFAVTQVFYTAQQWTELVRDARHEGIGMPILPGVIALASAARATRLTQLTGVEPPVELVNALEAAADDDAARGVGVDAAATLAQQLLDAGAPGVHVYTFNQHRAALEVVAQLSLGR